MRIISFGCSYTYGQGLEDCHIEPNLPGLSPSNYSWPSLLGQKLSLPIVNCSKPGFGNGAILNEILNFNFEKNDIVCVLWTFKTRDIIYKFGQESINTGRWNKDWYNKQDLYDLSIKNLLHIHHAHCFLKILKIQNYFMDVDFYQDLGKSTPKCMNDINFIKLNFRAIEKAHPLGLDNLHPGPNFHKKIAIELEKTIKNELGACG